MCVCVCQYVWFRRDEDGIFVGTREGWILVSVRGVGGVWVLAYDRSPLVGASYAVDLRVNLYAYLSIFRTNP